MRWSRRSFAHALASTSLLAVAAPAAAQGPASTGVNLYSDAGVQRDLRWDVAVGGAAPIDAFLVTTPPSPPWAPNTASYAWISASSNASLGGGRSYVYTTQFDLGGLDAATASLSFRCTGDNTFISYMLNATLFTSGCGDGSNGFQFRGTQTLSAGFVPGQNTLQFTYTGDGTTDGLVVDVQSFRAAVIPEPGTYALLATGLLGVAGVATRRRRARG